jgi:transcriptional regulator with XRE-family HTH domain
MDWLVAFGEAIRAERRRQGLTQAQLAERAGLHHNYISLVERGNTAPALDTVLALAEALGCKVSRLVAAAEARLEPGDAGRAATGRPKPQGR